MGGCARTAVEPEPVPAFVDADRLVRLHPDWSRVAELDRRIAWLSAYRVSVPDAPESVRVGLARPTAATAEADLAALTRRLGEKMQVIRAAERRSLERELERERRQARTGIIQAERRRIEEEATRRFQAVLDARGSEMANLAVRLTAVSGLETSYRARGTAWETLAAEMGKRREAVAAQIDEAHAARTTEVEAVFQWIQDEFARAASLEDQNARDWIETNQARIDELNRSLAELSRVLNDTLVGSILPAQAAVRASTMRLDDSAEQPPVPGPGLEAKIAALRSRRDRLARFALQNTRAVIKSAAGTMDPPVEPVFQRDARGFPDRTSEFSRAVASPARIVPLQTQHGDL